MNDAEYIAWELNKARGGEIVQVKARGAERDSRWVNLSPDQHAVMVAALAGELRAVPFERDGDAVTNGREGETWEAVYLVPRDVAEREGLTEGDAERYGAPYFRRITSV